MLKDRQKELLKALLEAYKDFAEPVASGYLAVKIKGKLSPATIRNELGELEKQGYIIQPHTSAGRIPTAKAYRFYVNNFLNERETLSKKIVDRIDRAFGENDDARMTIKEVSKLLAEEINAAVIAAFQKNDNYYTGLTNLFSQPEFKDQEFIMSVGEVIDKVDNIFNRFFEDDAAGIKIILGEENPFSQKCGLVYTKYKYEDLDGIIMILAPLRTDYQKGHALLRAVTKNLEQ
jgi:transcriptional regulator of heat shock response